MLLYGADDAERIGVVDGPMVVGAEVDERIYVVDSVEELSIVLETSVLEETSEDEELVSGAIVDVLEISVLED